jgi:hypothetical protein
MGRAIHLRQTILMPLVMVITTCMLVRCASDGGSGQEEEIIQGQQSQGSQNTLNNATLNNTANSSNGNNANNADLSQAGESMNNAVEGGSAENFANGATNSNPMNVNLGNTGNQTAGESINNVPLANNLIQNNGNPLATNPNTMQSNPITNGAALNPSLTVSETPPTNGTPTNNAAATPEIPQETVQTTTPSNGDQTARAAASPFANPHMNWPGKGKVKYVTRQLTRHASPNGPVVGEFEQGNHPLIYQNGNWAELHDGTFVRGNGLSEKGIGYGKGSRRR